MGHYLAAGKQCFGPRPGPFQRGLADTYAVRRDRQFLAWLASAPRDYGKQDPWYAPEPRLALVAVLPRDNRVPSGRERCAATGGRPSTGHFFLDVLDIPLYGCRR